MHCPGGHLLPGPKFIPELLPAPPEPFANTCHPLSVTKGPAPRWPRCPQAATAASLLPCQPLVQPCLLLCPERGDTARLLPGVPSAPRGDKTRGDKARVARSLPPCAPRCPEPARLRLPPCGIRGSSASCRARARPRRAPECPQGCPEVTGRYSLPLRGVTECPPQPFLREVLGALRCSRGYPTQEFVTFVTCGSEGQSLSGARVAQGTQDCPQLRGVTHDCPHLWAVTQECPQLWGVSQECPQLRAVTQECPQLRAGTHECSQLRAVTHECPQLRGMTHECSQLRAVSQGTKECRTLRAVTKECPPLRAVTKECSQLRAVTKGTKECPPLRAGTKECPQLRAVTKVTKECPPLRAVTKECPQVRAVTKGTKECRTLRAVTKECPPLRAVTKGSAQQPGRCRCPQHPRGPPRPSRLSSAKRSGHAKKNRCASKWPW